MCDVINVRPLNSRDKTWNMYFDYEDRLLVCTIDKVGSTNWYHQFLRLGLLRQPGVISWENTTRDELRDIHYRIKSGEKVVFMLKARSLEVTAVVFLVCIRYRDSCN